MAQSLCERPDLELAAGTLLVGRMWNRRRWIYTIPNSNVAMDTQAGYLRITTLNSQAMFAFARTTPVSVQTLLVKFRRPTISGCKAVFYISSSADNNGGSTGFTPTTGYGVTISSSTAPVLNKITGGTISSVLGTSAGVKPTTANAWYWLKLDRTATDVRFRIWADGSTEPSSWDVDATESANPAGVVEIALGTSPSLELDLEQITVSQPGLIPPPRPLTFRDMTGKRMPSGTVSHVKSDDGSTATQSADLTGTTTQSATKWQRIISAAGSSSATVSLPAGPSADINAYRATLRGVVSSGNTAQTFLGLVNGSNQLGIQQTAVASSDATIVLPSSLGGNIPTGGLDWIGESGSGFNPNLTVELNLRNVNPGFAGQLLFWAAEDNLVYYVDLATVPSGAWTPTVIVTATTGTAVTVAYRQFEATYESGSDW